VRRDAYPVVTVRLGLLETAATPGAIELALKTAAPESKWHGRPGDHGVSPSEEVEPEAVAIELSGGSDALPRLLAQLGDRVRSMSLRREALEDFRRVWLPLLEREDGRADVRADRAFWSALHPDHPYGRRPAWSALRGLDRQAAQRWLHEAYTPDRAILTVVGDLELDQAARSVTEWLGDWKPIR